MDMIDTWKQRIQQLKKETYALYLAYKDPRVPWYARVWLAIVVSYALSPIDLIPDFIPILGYLDDLVLLPVGILIAIKLIPEPVLAECRHRAQAELAQDKPTSRAGVILIIMVWLTLATLLMIFFVR